MSEKSIKKKQKAILKVVKTIRIVNIALIIAFLIDLYFWIKRH